MTSMPRLTPTRSVLPFEALARTLEGRLSEGARLGLLTARPSPDPAASTDDAPAGIRLVAIVVDPAGPGMEILETDLPPGAREFPSMTPRVPQVHWFERAIEDMFGPVPVGHPRPKGLLLHEAWPANWHPFLDVPAGRTLPGREAPRREYPFLVVKGEGVYEIPVGPIHAGIIEPGHFRFSCLGEVVQNLEIRLGYQHRGAEMRLAEVPWRHARFVAEAVSGDTTVGNALAHAGAMEQLLGVAPPALALDLRAMALEIERVASHLADLGGICNDIGFAGGAAMFARFRGQALGLGERPTGARFQTAFVVPGGVRRPLDPAQAAEMGAELQDLQDKISATLPLLLDNPGALERMEGTGVVRPSLARDFGLVGPAGRASGALCDARVAFRQEPYATLGLEEPRLETGDVLARVQIRAFETRASLGLLGHLLERARIATDGGGTEATYRAPLPDRLPPDSVGVGIAEAWRGELIHAVFTDAEGKVSRYAVKDPSFQNWTGLAIAVRGELVSDFPLCNKSFGLSYSGNDL